jgi:hypothetical protein
MDFTLKSRLDKALSFPYVAGTAGVTAGAFVTIGSVNGFPHVTKPDSEITFGQNIIGEPPTTSTQTVALIVKAEEVLVKKGSGAWTQGQVIYWNGTEAVTASTGNTKIGWARVAASSGATEGYIRFDGELGV